MSMDSSGRPQLTLSTNVLYGFGSVAFGVHQVALTSILTLFFNQVVGLPAAWVGMEMMVTMVFDAICDPLIGEWSDHAHSRWGRRHPFMYASALPAAVAFYLLFVPPIGWTQHALFLFLVVMLILVRVLLSLYEIPSTALGPELTFDYDQRTTLMGSRFFFGAAGGAVLAVLAFQVFLRKDAAHPLGVLNRTGYAEFGLVSAIAIFVSIMVSCIGTHRFIDNVVHEPKEKASWRERLREAAGTMTNRSFIALAVSGTIGAISMGLTQGLELYIATYYFELTPAQISYFAALMLPAALLGVLLSTPVSSRFGKKPSMLAVLFGSLFFSYTTLITMRLLGILPANGTHALLTLLLVTRFISLTLGLMGFIIATSMMADVVEDAAVTTGHRSEGLLFAANGLISKCVTGLGTFLSGMVLAWISFPQHAIQGQVDPAVIRHLGLVFVPVVVAFGAVGIAVLMFYDIDRSTHERNLEQLETKLDQNGPGGQDAQAAAF